MIYKADDGSVVKLPCEARSNAMATEEECIAKQGGLICSDMFWVDLCM